MTSRKLWGCLRGCRGTKWIQNEITTRFSIVLVQNQIPNCTDDLSHSMLITIIFKVRLAATKKHIYISLSYVKSKHITAAVYK